MIEHYTDSYVVSAAKNLRPPAPAGRPPPSAQRPHRAPSTAPHPPAHHSFPSRSAGPGSITSFNTLNHNYGSPQSSSMSSPNKVKMRFKCFLPTKQTTVDLDVDDSMEPADIRERLLISVGISQRERKNYVVRYKVGFPPADITLDEEDGGTVSPLMARKGDAITANITIAQHLTKANESKVHSIWLLVTIITSC